MGRSKLDGGSIVCATLERLGVDTIFGVPGSENLSIFEALRQSSLRTVLATNEMAATFMANGYFRASGKVAAVTTIHGPGFTYALTGLAEAAHDSAALLHITAVLQNRPRREFQLQRIDQETIAAPIVKEYYKVRDASLIRKTMTDAYARSVTGEPGPVVIEIDYSALRNKADFSTDDPIPVADKISPKYKPLNDVVELLAGSGKVTILAGQGASDAPEQLRNLAEFLNAPVVTTSSGRGVLPEDHRLSFDVDFSVGYIKQVNKLVEQSDLILALGCKFSHNGSSGFELHLPPEKLIHVDSSTEVLSANYPARLLIEADVGLFLDDLWEQRHQFEDRPPGFKEADLKKWKASLQIAKLKGVYCEPKIKEAKDVNWSRFFEILTATLPETACVVTDTGFHQTLVRNYIRIKSARGLVMPSDFQSMGFGIPAAIGAKISSPEREVAAIVGDGCFAISGMELITAVRENLDLTVIVFNDGNLGSIRLMQIARFGHEYSVNLHNPDYAKFAESLGATYFLFRDNPKAVLEKCLQTSGVKLLEVRLKDSLKMKGLPGKSIIRRNIKESFLYGIIKKLER